LELRRGYRAAPAGVRPYGCGQTEVLKMLRPPSTIRDVPVMEEASGDARNVMAAATSAGVPNRLAVVCSMLRRRSSPLVLSHMRVRIAQGRTALTRTVGPYSAASCCVSAASPPFAAAQAGSGSQISACAAEVITTAP
jgi:hypothetical protein